MNSTISSLLRHRHPIESVEVPTAINELAPVHYDSAGAALFIAVVLFWYAMVIICLLGVEIPGRADTIEDCTRRRTKLFLQTLRDQTQTKQILEELCDKQNRDKLWDIYLGKTNQNKEKLKRAETRRISNIKKQLATINRNRIIMNDTIITPMAYSCIRRTSLDAQSTLIPTLSSIENQPRNRRRSSLDQQIIERWKLMADQSKAHEQLPWTIRKVLIHRHFRRYCKGLSPDSERTVTFTNGSSSIPEHDECLDDEQCQLLSPAKPSNDRRLRRRSREPTDRLNPYITYFHLPIDENFDRDNENMSLVTVKSHHQIIQLYHDESQC